MNKIKVTRPSISKTDKNWYTEQEISIIKKAAFDKGFEHGSEINIKTYAENLIKAQVTSTDFFYLAKTECSIEFKQIRLKAQSINSFELIFIMPEGDFLSKEKYRKVAECGLNFLDKVGDDVSLTFLYMPYNEDLNDNEFILNGFSFTYDPNRVFER